jgi:hydroxymethylbilane synthase
MCYVTIRTSLIADGQALATDSLIIGSRGSPLALTQARLIKQALIVGNGLAEDKVVIETINTSGDRIQNRALRDVGGKALFTTEIESALLEKRIDLAVHSLKDVETVMPEGLMLAATPEREDPRDALISADGMAIADLPRGAVFGTSSLRRQSQILAYRPDMAVRLLRGNVGTRIEKVRSGEFQATALALAGLNRLGRAGDATAVIDPDILLPAVGQGILGLQIRRADERVAALLGPLNHAESFAAATAERAMLHALEGDCYTPVGGYATIAKGRLTLRGRLLSADGRSVFNVRREGPVADAEAMGRDAGEQLRREAGDRFFETQKAG